MSNAPVTSVTDELIAELEADLATYESTAGPVRGVNLHSVRALLAEREELKRDAARYSWLIRQAWFQSAMDRYDIDDGGMQARFEAETARIIDAAMQS